MVEIGVRFFWVLSTFLLTSVYVIAWARFQIVSIWPAFNPVDLHFATAIPITLFHFFTALGVLFYFIGTGVWIKDRAFEIAPHDRPKAEKIYDIYKSANKLKGRVFPFITFTIFFGIMTFVLGGARSVEAIPLWLHPLTGTGLLLVSVASMPFVFSSIRKNMIFLDQASEILES